MINAIDISILIFLVILGIMVDLMNSVWRFRCLRPLGPEGREPAPVRAAADHAAGRA